MGELILTTKVSDHADFLVETTEIMQNRRVDIHPCLVVVTDEETLPARVVDGFEKVVFVAPEQFDLFEQVTDLLAALFTDSARHVTGVGSARVISVNVDASTTADGGVVDQDLAGRLGQPLHPIAAEYGQIYGIETPESWFDTAYTSFNRKSERGVTFKRASDDSWIRAAGFKFSEPQSFTETTSQDTSPESDRIQPSTDGDPSSASEESTASETSTDPKQSATPDSSSQGAADDQESSTSTHLPNDSNAPNTDEDETEHSGEHGSDSEVGPGGDGDIPADKPGEAATFPKLDPGDSDTETTDSETSSDEASTSAETDSSTGSASGAPDKNPESERKPSSDNGSPTSSSGPTAETRPDESSSNEKDGTTGGTPGAGDQASPDPDASFGTPESADPVDPSELPGIPEDEQTPKRASGNETDTAPEPDAPDTDYTPIVPAGETPPSRDPLIVDIETHVLNEVAVHAASMVESDATSDAEVYGTFYENQEGLIRYYHPVDSEEFVRRRRSSVGFNPAFYAHIRHLAKIHDDINHRLCGDGHSHPGGIPRQSPADKRFSKRFWRNEHNHVFVIALADGDGPEEWVVVDDGYEVRRKSNGHLIRIRAFAGGTNAPKRIRVHTDMGG